jgi:hypothetical protein
MTGCPARIPEHWKFSITSLAVKSLTRIRDESEIFNMPIIPAKNVMILRDGQEKRTDCRFFRHEPLIMNRRIPRDDYNSEKGSMPFASLPNKPRVYCSRQAMTGPVCHDCLLDLSEEAPPEYAENPEVERSTLELVGK